MIYEILNPEVLVTDESLVQISSPDIESLKTDAGRNERKRIRLCAHQDINDRLHEMLIVHTKEAYVRPHKHFNKSESVHIIEGLVEVVLFDEIGNIREVIRMGDYASGHRFYYRMSVPIYHTLLIRSEMLVFHETTNGPFIPADTIFAPWAPDEGDIVARQAYIERLEKLLAR